MFTNTFENKKNIIYKFDLCNDEEVYDNVN